ncbi:hypothetical protein FHU38_003865 [Saccharomonospora amisosensis]|uniref:Uncharacterized protein n=1 Tax=Saccharomonospora amisosensis TaxID=1128677 RepID=A0A7X5USP2_9PSEU|nr:hypothetical protein [Saccharomonospora amisosensis]
MRPEKLWWTGVAGPALFTLIWLVEGVLRPGYDPMRNWISELALSERGWIQIVNFLPLDCFSRCTASPCAALSPAERVRSGHPDGSWPPGWPLSWRGCL